jgi:proliferating cell nuclear antigen
MTTISCEAGQFKKFIEAITSLNSECRLHFSKDGITTRLVDTANVAMIGITYPKSAMKMYKFSEKCPEQVGMDWTKTTKILSATRPNTPLTVKFTKDRMHISYSEISGSVKYIDSNAIRKDPNPPTIVLKGKVAFEGNLLSKFNKVIIGDKIILTIKNGLANIETQYVEDNVKMLLAQDVKGEFRSIYSWDYLKDMAKVLNGTYVDCSFDTDHPLSLTSTIKGIEIRYLLAPRIEA